MIAFVVRRLIISVCVFLVATFVLYALTASSGNPLADLAEIADAGDRANRIAARTELLNLDEPIPVRWFQWLVGVLSFLVPGADGTFGPNVLGQDVGPLLSLAIGATLRLIVVATVVAVVTGVVVGTLSALRQYTGFDYTITFASFVFFALPIFWAAILLKQFGAIQFNTWLADPVISWPWIIGIALLSGLLWMGLLGGSTRRRLVVLAVAGFGTAGVLIFLSADRWFTDPSLGPVTVTALSILGAVGVTAFIAGFGRRRVLYAGLAGTGVGLLVYFLTLLTGVFLDPTWLLLIGVFLATLVAAGVVGALMGGIDRSQAVRTAVGSAAVVSALGFVDWALVYFATYTRSVNGRPIATIGSNTPNFSGNLWVTFLDTTTHLILPSITLILISFALYTRFQRASMLETMNAEYVRTARSKGLTERAVIVRHALRNALVPITTLVTLDVASILGGAVITETVFGWVGMGKLFVDGLTAVDPNPVMAFFIVSGSAIIIGNLIADVLYAYLDPRIKVA